MISRKSLVLIFALSCSDISALAAATAQKIFETVGSELVEPLIKEIKSMPASARRRIAKEIVILTSQEFASGLEYHNGKKLIHVLPSIADDDILAQILEPYLANQDESVRSVAFEALSRGHGPAVDKLIVETIQLSLDKLPTPPFKPTDEESARITGSDFVAFVYCLEGLLRSDSSSARDVGARYLTLFRSRYSGSTEGPQIVEAIERELTRAGLPIGVIAPLALPKPIPSPSSTPPIPSAAMAASTPSATPFAKTPSAQVEQRAPEWPRVVGILALVVIVAFALKRRTQPPCR